MQIPLGKQEHLKEFFEMMELSGREEQAKDVEELLRYLHELKNGFSEALEEIDYLKGQIDIMQSQSLKARFGKMQEDVMEAIQQAKESAEEVGGFVKEEISRALAAGRQKGIQAAAALVGCFSYPTGIKQNRGRIGTVFLFLVWSGYAYRRRSKRNSFCQRACKNCRKHHVWEIDGCIWRTGSLSGDFGKNPKKYGILPEINEWADF